eukprot:SM000021S06463  [mRNA]  locus=s21:516320:521198:+ [translate_table: standard]
MALAADPLPSTAGAATAATPAAAQLPRQPSDGNADCRPPAPAAATQQLLGAALPERPAAASEASSGSASRLPLPLVPGLQPAVAEAQRPGAGDTAERLRRVDHGGGVLQQQPADAGTKVAAFQSTPAAAAAVKPDVVPTARSALAPPMTSYSVAPGGIPFRDLLAATPARLLTGDAEASLTAKQGQVAEPEAPVVRSQLQPGGVAAAAAARTGMAVDNQDQGASRLAARVPEPSLGPRDGGMANGSSEAAVDAGSSAELRQEGHQAVAAATSEREALATAAANAPPPSRWASQPAQVGEPPAASGLSSWWSVISPPPAAAPPQTVPSPLPPPPLRQPDPSTGLLSAAKPSLLPAPPLSLLHDGRVGGGTGEAANARTGADGVGETLALIKRTDATNGQIPDKAGAGAAPGLRSASMDSANFGGRATTVSATTGEHGAAVTTAAMQPDVKPAVKPLQSRGGVEQRDPGFDLAASLHSSSNGVSSVFQPSFQYMPAFRPPPPPAFGSNDKKPASLPPPSAMPPPKPAIPVPAASMAFSSSAPTEAVPSSAYAELVPPGPLTAGQLPKPFGAAAAVDKENLENGAPLPPPPLRSLSADPSADRMMHVNGKIGHQSLSFAPSETSEFASLEQHIEDLTQEKFAFQRGLEAAQALAASLAQENEALTHDFNNQGGVVSQLQVELEQQAKAIRAQKAIVKSMQAEKERAQQESVAATERSQALAGEVLKLRSQELKLERQVEELLAHQSLHERTVQALERDRANLRSMVEALQEEKRFLQVRVRQAAVEGALDEVRQPPLIATVDVEDAGQSPSVVTSTASEDLIAVAQEPLTPLPTPTAPLPSLAATGFLSPSPSSLTSSERLAAAMAAASSAAAGAATSRTPRSPLAAALPLVAPSIPAEDLRLIASIDAALSELTDERAALMKAFDAETAAAAELRATNTDLSRKLAYTQQQLELAVAQRTTAPRQVANSPVATAPPSGGLEYVDEGDEVVERVLGWIMQLFPGGSARRSREKRL